MDLRADGTGDCETCRMPMFPVALSDAGVALECANRHRATAPVPDDPKLRRFVQNWVARKGAQLEEQHFIFSQLRAFKDIATPIPEERVRRVRGVKDVENLMHLPGTQAPTAP